MKKLFVLILAVSGFTAPAMAQNNEQQVYYPPYVATSGLTQQDLINRENYIIARNQARLEGRYNVERDPYATLTPGRIPQHPGDYRDAFDRGELPNLGNSQKQNIPIQRY